jgi:hypothetical protein
LLKMTGNAYIDKHGIYFYFYWIQIKIFAFHNFCDLLTLYIFLVFKFYQFFKLLQKF